MIIDTTTNINNFEKTFRDIYFKKYISLRNEFTKWIDKIGFKEDLDWWISFPASRNYNQSNLFHNFCLIESLKEIFVKKKVKKVIVESKNLKEILKNQLKVKAHIDVKNNNNNLFISNFYLILKNFIFYFIIYIFSNFGRSNTKINNSGLVLIDTFLEDSNLNKNRYYSDFFVKKAFTKKNILFVPSFYTGMGLFETIKKIERCKKNRNFLLKERYLKFKDFLQSIFLIFRRKNLKSSFIKLKKVNYTRLIIDELYLNKFLSGQILGWQNYLFFKNLNKKKIGLKKCINWFENQSQDKGWNLGVRTFFPKTKCYGYQGFTSFPQYMCLSPSESEYSSKVIPKIILSIGKKFNGVKKEFCKKLIVKTAPALSFQYLYKNKNKFSVKKNNILIILSGFLDDDVNLLNWVISSKIYKENKKILIKEHPILKIKKIKKKLDHLPKEFIISKRSLWDTANISHTLICAGSTSAIIELVISGRPCIIPRLNPCDGEIFKKLKISSNFKVLEDSSKLISFINKFKIVKYDKKSYFTKLTKKNLNYFM